ncbi:unnamed protein product [Lactuca saligna]|uniref:Uncharacterized protein n=1 Tax=Lactuca saligna TaxID=75948 RepID=A0AA35YQ95_LACSI|nr:unnamed protein product [Lactuca saligna]
MLLLLRHPWSLSFHPFSETLIRQPLSIFKNPQRLCLLCHQWPPFFSPFSETLIRPHHFAFNHPQQLLLTTVSNASIQRGRKIRVRELEERYGHTIRRLRDLGSKQGTTIDINLGFIGELAREALQDFV